MHAFIISNDRGTDSVYTYADQYSLSSAIVPFQCNLDASKKSIYQKSMIQAVY